MVLKYLNEQVEAVVINDFNAEKYSLRDYHSGTINNHLACFMAALNSTRQNAHNLVKKVFDSLPQLKEKDRAKVKTAVDSCIANLDEEYNWLYERSI